jgi:hypothetical protein
MHMCVSRTQKVSPWPTSGQEEQVAWCAWRDSPLFGAWAWRPDWRGVAAGQGGTFWLVATLRLATTRGRQRREREEAVMAEHPQALQSGACAGVLWVARTNADAAFAGDCRDVPWQIGRGS